MKSKKPKTPEEIAAWAEKQKDIKDTPPEEIVAQIFDAIPVDLGTVNERKIMAVKLIPEHRYWSVTKICTIAGIDRKAWSRAHRREDFAARCIEFIKAIKGTFIPQIYMAMVKNALDGDTAAQKSLLEDVKAITRGQDEHGTPITLNFGQLLGNRNDDERGRQKLNTASIRANAGRGPFVISDN